MASRSSIRFRDVLARAAGWTWGAAWIWVVVRTIGVWDDLGGIVGERVLWLARFVPPVAGIVGCLVGKWSRMAAQDDPRRTHVLLLRWIFWPVAACVAVGLVALRSIGNDEVIGVVVSGFLGYWAGLDLGFAIWPLISGLHYSPFDAIQPDPSDPVDRDDDQDLHPDRRFPI